MCVAYNEKLDSTKKHPKASLHLLNFKSKNNATMIEKNKSLQNSLFVLKNKITKTTPINMKNIRLTEIFDV